MIRFEPLLRYRRLLIVAYLLAVVSTAPGVLRLRVDNSPEDFLADDAVALQHRKTLELSFGRDRGVRLVLSGDGLWTAKGLTWLTRLEDEVQRPGGVYGAAGPVTHHRWHLDQPPSADPAAFTRLVRSDPLDRHAGWLSADGTSVTVLVGFYEMGSARRQATLEQVEQMLTTAPPGVRAKIVGIPIINHALDASITTMALRYFPLLLLAGVVLLWLFFRSLSGVLLPLALVGASETVLLGTMGYAGQRLDVVTNLLVPLVFVISLATAVHVLAFHLTRKAADPVTRVADTYESKAWAVLWTGLTTATGFGSLAVSEVPAVRSLGLWAAFGIVFLTLAALSFYPALLAVTGRSGDVPGEHKPLPESRVRGWTRRGAQWSVDHRHVVTTAFTLAVLFTGAGLFRLHVGSNVVDYFRPDHPVRSDLEQLEARGIAGVGASLVLENSAGFRDAAHLQALRRLTAELRKEPLVMSAISLGDLTANVERYRGGDEASAVHLLDEEPDLEKLRAFLLYRNGKRTRILLGTAMRGWEDLQPVYDRAVATAGRLLPDSKAYVTGQYPLILEGQRTLLRTVVLSLSITLVVISLIFVLLLRNLSLAIRALIPNLWPVLVVLGLMGWLGVPVDSATVMIASVVLGLAVDDTLHVLAHYRRLEPETGPAPAVVESLGQAGAGVLVTSLILVLGFGTVSTSSLAPVAHFGMLASLAVLAALAADLWWVPALFSSARASRTADSPR